MYFTFLALAILFVGLFMFGGDTFIALYVSCFDCLLIYIYEFFIDIYLYLCCLKLRIYFVYLYFLHMRLCILFSVSGNIQVDSIELLSTLATDG